MKPLALAAALSLFALPLYAAQDEAAFFDGVIEAWKIGKAPATLRPPAKIRKLLNAEIVSVVVARINDADSTIVNSLCTFAAWPDSRDPAAPDKDAAWRVVFRITADPKAEGGFRISASWRDIVSPSADAPPPPPPAATAKLTSAQKASADKIFIQLKGTKLDAGGRAQKRDELAAMGLAVLDPALRELRTSDMEVRRDLVLLIRTLGPPDTLKLLREELAFAVSSCTKIVGRIQEDATQAADYRNRAAKIKQPTGGKVGGMYVPPEPTEKASFLRLAAEYDKKVAVSRRDLDACAEVIETLCADLIRSGSPEDLALMTTLITDKAAPVRPTAWGEGVIADDEHLQVPPVGFSARRPVSVAGQEQDWLPWGPVWGALRTIAAKCPKREALQALRDEMEKNFAPMEKRRSGTWQQQCLVSEFQRTEAAVIVRLSAPDGPAPAPAAPVDYAGEAKDRMLAALAGFVEKPGEDPVEKRRREGRAVDLRRTIEDTAYRIVMKRVTLEAISPDPKALPSKGPGDPVFTVGDFDFAKERLTVNAFLDVRDLAGGAKSRVLLGTWEMPLKAAQADDIQKGKRRARLELTGHVWVSKAAPRTIGNLTDLVTPVILDRLILVDDATGEVLSEKKREDAKADPDAPKEAPKDAPAKKESAPAEGDRVIEK